MKTKTFQPGDKILLKTKTRDWQGHALQSHDPEIILLKLKSGYNIGIRESEILTAKVIQKRSDTKHRHPDTPTPRHPDSCHEWQ